MAKPRGWNWVVYLPCDELVLVFNGYAKPLMYDHRGNWYQHNGSAARLCPEEFKHTFGFLPEPDKPVKVAFTATLHTPPKQVILRTDKRAPKSTPATARAKPTRRLYTCPECNTMSDGSTHHTPGGRQCDMVKGRRGWRQLGVYDG